MAGLRSRGVGDGACELAFPVVNPGGEILPCFFFLVRVLPPGLGEAKFH